MVSILKNNIYTPEHSKLSAGLLLGNRNEPPQLPLPREFQDIKSDLQARNNRYHRQFAFVG